MKKRIVVDVETDLTDKQIESHGATLYLLEPGGDCHIAQAVRVVHPTKTAKTAKADADYLRELADRIEAL